MRLGALAVLLTGLVGCATTSGMGTARTLPQGKTSVLAGAEMGWISSRPLVSATARLDLGVRHGLTDDWELGAHAGGWLLGVQWGHVGVDLKRRLARAPEQGAGWDVSLGGALAADAVYSAGLTGTAWTVQVPLLCGYKLPHGDELFFSPRLVGQHVRSRGAAPVTKPLAGLTVGWAFRPGRLTLFPTVGALVGTNPADVDGGLVSWQSGFMVAFQ